ncbi:hypothetical protein HY405_02340 [Candidatus Microgenomates bacterium]|nr:hypothetical protein [Candidatus Microgenomates bacterium]
MGTKPTKPSKGAAINKAQMLESLRDLSDDVSGTMRNTAAEISRDFFKELIGAQIPERKITGDLEPGDSLEMTQVLSGQWEEKKKLQAELAQERRIRAEEQRLANKKQQELRIQLSTLTQEVVQLAHTTHGLSKEIQVAVMAAPVEPGVYHVIFFEKLVQFIQSFRKKIENASEWLALYNGRASKRAKTFWGQVATGGAKRMLSGEDYSQRAAA